MFMTKREKWLIYGLMILATLVTVVPFIWMIITSFKTQAESIAFPPILLPANPGFQAYGKILHEMPFGSFYFNSIVSTLVIVILQTLIAAMAASVRFLPTAFQRTRCPVYAVYFNSDGARSDLFNPTVFNR